MTRLPHCGWLWLANLLVPGAGLVMLGRWTSGVLLAALWGLAVGGLLLMGFVWPGATVPAAVMSFGASAVTVYAGAQIVLYLRRRVLAGHLAGPARDAMFKAALVAYLQGRLDEAETACRTLLAIDPDDVEATLHLGAIARRRGRPAAARRYFEHARYLDDEGRWDFQIERELAALVESGKTSSR